MRIWLYYDAVIWISVTNLRKLLPIAIFGEFDRNLLSSYIYPN